MKRGVMSMSATDKAAYGLLLMYGVILVALAFLSEGSYGGADSWLHFQMAKYAPQHPELFLDQWGKPGYTILACLPSQIGFIGAKLFNVACGLLSAFLAYRMARHQFESLTWLAVVFVLSVPIYFVCLFSGLTESVFALCIMAAVYLFHIYRIRVACLVISFLPFIRSEGFLFLPLFALMCVFYRRWIALPFLLVGFLVFTIIGYFVYGTWNWVFGTNVYLTKATNYGSGPWYHFFETHSATFGWAFTVFIIVAICGFLWQAITNPMRRELHIQVMLLFGGLVLYFAAHSYFWYKGIYGSAGLDRVMAGVGPCIGYTAFCGFQFLWNIKASWLQKIKPYLLGAGVLWVFIMPRYVYSFPFELTRFQQMEVKAVAYIQAQGLDTLPSYYADPFFPFQMKHDPFNKVTSLILYQHADKPFLPGCLVLWDSHLCPREALLPLEVMEAHPVELLQRYAEPDEYNSKDTMEIRIYRTR